MLKGVHDPEYIQYVQTAHSEKIRFLDSGDTRVTPDLFDQALLSASAGIEAIAAVMKGQLRSAFCGVRPPGHHANSYRAMGFCIFNNIALAARFALDHYDIKKILIIDWDVHPGNGTQEIFWDDSSVFVLSFHQADLFEESGHAGLEGEGRGTGFNRNVPFPAETPREIYLKTFKEVVEATAVKLKPDVLMISAGFDAHFRDPSSNMTLTSEDFGTMTRMALKAAQPFTAGRTLSVLEGGYNISALKECVVEHLKALVDF